MKRRIRLFAAVPGSGGDLDRLFAVAHDETIWTIAVGTWLYAPPGWQQIESLPDAPDDMRDQLVGALRPPTLSAIDEHRARADAALDQLEQAKGQPEEFYIALDALRKATEYFVAVQQSKANARIDAQRRNGEVTPVLRQAPPGHDDGF